MTTTGPGRVRSVPAWLRRRGWLLFGALAGAGIAAHAALPRAQLVQSAVYDLVGASAVAAILVGVALHRPARPLPWLLFALAQLLFVVGDVAWTVLAAVTGETPFPSVADLAYLAGYPFLALAMIACVRLRVRGGDRAGLLDGAILAAGASLVGWVVLVDPVLAASIDLDPLSLAVSAAYPLMDLLVIGVAFGFLATPGSRSPSFLLLLGSLATILAADVLFAFQTAGGTYVEGGSLEPIWLVSYALGAAAALHPSMREVAAPQPVPVAWLSHVRLGGLAAAILVGPAVLLLQSLASGAGLPVLSIGSAMLGLLVLARLALVVELLDEDVAARRRLEAELSFQAAHDPLTGLANRRSFVARLDDVGTGAAAPPFALLFVDLDDFKTINDTFGHVAGDEVLAIIARRIEGSVRPTDLAARMGGDEFAVLLLEAEAARAREVAERLLASLAAPIAIAGGIVEVRASVGIADSTIEVSGVEELIRDSDVAMYRAKALGKGRYHVFEPADAAAAGGRREAPAAAGTAPRDGSRVRTGIGPAAPSAPGPSTAG